MYKCVLQTPYCYPTFWQRPDLKGLDSYLHKGLFSPPPPKILLSTLSRLRGGKGNIEQRIIDNKGACAQTFYKSNSFGNAHCDFLFCTIPILHRFVRLVLLHALNALWDIGSFKVDSTDYKPKHRLFRPISVLLFS